MSQITILNNTQEAVRVAVFRKPVLRPTLNTIAWRVVAPPPGGHTVVPIPDDYAAFASHSSDPREGQDPNAGARTNTIAFRATTASFLVQQAQDPRTNAAVMTQTFVDLVANAVRIENQFGALVWTHITKDRNDVLAPQAIVPGAVLTEDLCTNVHVAVVAQFVSRGERGIPSHSRREREHVVAA